MRKRAIDIEIGEITIYATNKSCIITDSDIQECFDCTQNFSIAQYVDSGIQLEDEENSIISDSIFSYGEYFENYRCFVEVESDNCFLNRMSGWSNTPCYNKKFMIFDLGFKLEIFYDMVKYVADDVPTYNK